MDCALVGLSTLPMVALLTSQRRILNAAVVSRVDDPALAGAGHEDRRLL